MGDAVCGCPGRWVILSDYVTTYPRAHIGRPRHGQDGAGVVAVRRRAGEGDAIKETLFDSLGEGDREWSRKLGAATFDLLYILVEWHLKADQSVVAEAAFTHEYAARWLDRMKEGYDFDILELHCHTDPDTALRRYVERARSNERHSGHDSGMSPDAIADELRKQYDQYGPVTDGDELVRIDTTDFAAVDYEGIIERVRSALG